MNLGEPIATGNTAKIYRYENKAVKIFNDFLPDNEATREAHKQKLASSCGLPVPKVFDVTQINGRQAIIMELVEGRTIGDIVLENKEKKEDYMKISIDIQQEIHRIVPRSLETMTEKLTRQIESAHHLDKKQRIALLQKMESMTFEERLCHGDYHLFNLIMSEDKEKVTIIDWVDCSAGDIRADVYRTYLLYSQFSVELAHMYLRQYCDHSGLSKEEVFQWAPIIAGARLSENVSSESSKRLLEIVHEFCPSS
ncbi:phosphotransferase family protein [Evansella halocellulosilytica]|uniref:phosphotransferase family protein n=1 Tax=Evansella halocellulosilytica TaxID=2011013 RepID=UPI000BB89EE0|nr:aminoglycoside phosphotransferase family protein [Evansella halocellulosilytica]